MSPRGSRIVAIVGRPNVGKSTLFNALIGRRVAIVDDEPGVTRDRVYHSFKVDGGDAVLVDTGGLLMDPRGSIELGVREQALLACEEADVVLFVVDGRVPSTTEDEAIARLLRERHRPTILVANKMDSEQDDPSGLAYVSLGLGEPLLVSARGRRGLRALKASLVPHLPPAPAMEGSTAPAVAIIGKPNVGKSSLLNRLVGAPRAVVDDKPGTTRDAVDTVATLGGHTFRLIDTAGIRRRSHHEEGVGYYAYLRALGAVERCDVAALLVDATQRDLEIVELKLAHHVLLAGKALVIVANKWDLVEGQEASRRWRELIEGYPSLRGVPLRHVSARTGRGVPALPGVFADLATRRSRRFSPEELAAVVRHIRAVNPPPSNRGRLNRVCSLHQAEGPFPQFRMRLDDPAGLPGSYVRYLRNTLIELLHLGGIGFELVLTGPGS